MEAKTTMQHTIKVQEVKPNPNFETIEGLDETELFASSMLRLMRMAASDYEYWRRSDVQELDDSGDEPATTVVKWYALFVTEKSATWLKFDPAYAERHSDRYSVTKKFEEGQWEDIDRGIMVAVKISIAEPKWTFDLLETTGG